MPVYKLKNGLSIDLKFDTPTVFTPRPAKLDFDRFALYDSSLDAYPFPIDASGNTIPGTQVIKMNASGTLSGASADVFQKCSLQFIQLIKVQAFVVEYLGKHNDEGSVNWRWTNRLLERNIDCVVREGKDSSPFMFPYPEKSEHLPPNTLKCRLSDTPGASIPLAEKNEKSKLNNYLRKFTDIRGFESIVTFVHPDGSREMLESWKWAVSRTVALKWVKLRPEFDGPNQPTVKAAVESAVVFGKDDDYADAMLSGNVANRLTGAALNNRRGSPDISYAEFADPEFLWPDGFWAP